MDQNRWVLFGGDVLALVIVTLAGFATHAELDAGLRMLTTFLPSLAAWALAAPWLGLYRSEITLNPRQLWRPAVAALLAAPLAAWLRGAWLGSPILSIFILVMVITLALALSLWRTLWMLIYTRQVSHG